MTTRRHDANHFDLFGRAKPSHATVGARLGKSSLHHKNDDDGSARPMAGSICPPSIVIRWDEVESSTARAGKLSCLLCAGTFLSNLRTAFAVPAESVQGRLTPKRSKIIDGTHRKAVADNGARLMAGQRQPTMSVTKGIACFAGCWGWFTRKALYGGNPTVEWNLTTRLLLFGQRESVEMILRW